MPKRTRATAAAASPATSMEDYEVQSSFDGDDVEGSVASSSTHPSAAKRQRKAAPSSSSTASSGNNEKDQRKTARKERNRISAQLSRDRKKNERSELESRIAATEARNLALEEENRQLRERVQQSQAMEAQLHLLQKRFEELEKVLSGAKQVQQDVGSGNGEGEVREDSRIGSETHAKATFPSTINDAVITTTPTTFSAPLLHQPQPQSFLSFDFLESLEAQQQQQTPSSSSSMSSSSSSSVNGSSLDQAFLLPSPTLPAITGQAAEEEGDFSHLFNDHLSQDLLNFDFSTLQFPTNAASGPMEQQSFAPNVHDDLFFGDSYDSLMSNNGNSILV